ncbi:hypothetical protein G6024_14705 [Dietzia maris]|nr:hypothetical protein [Dietzia maris]MBB0998321.1 hypothetical protein [Dietzia maris]
MSNKKDKSKAVTKKLRQERNKYFVPDFGEVDAESLDAVPSRVEELKKKREEGDGNS